jgi:acetylornithine deacetylase/succinyl-diaminopimelate desuccinylase-like protein
MAMDEVVRLARDLVAIDSRSSVSNLAVAERIEAELAGLEVERIDYRDADGVAKRVLVAGRGTGGLAFSGHMDTVPDTGWTENPWSAAIIGGALRGLGSADMKGPVAACILAVRAAPPEMPVALIITTDEETTKAGARAVIERSALARRLQPCGIVVAEPTRMMPVRGHRAHVAFTATATGVQAHSATGLGRNANWDLVTFLSEMKAIHERLSNDPKLQDPAYDPVVSDFNLLLDNYGAAINVTVPRATVRIKYRYSAGIDAAIVVDAVRAAAHRAGLVLEEAREGSPPELPADHPLIRLAVTATGHQASTAPYGTDASVLQELAPCVVMGPGDIGLAHRDGEHIPLADLVAAVPVFTAMAVAAARGLPA